jgi:hypothetical protein
VQICLKILALRQIDLHFPVFLVFPLFLAFPAFLSKFKEEIKKILKKALISAHKNGKYEVAELTKKINNLLMNLKIVLLKAD